MSYDELVLMVQREVREVYRGAKKGISAVISAYIESILPKKEAETKQDEREILSRSMNAGGLLVIAGMLYEANKKAKNRINRAVPRAFAESMNQEAYEIEREIGEQIGLIPVSEEDIAEWLDENPEVYATEELNKRKDEKWNTANVRNLIITGVLLGIGASRLSGYVTGNVIRRNERTMLQNAFDTVSSAGEAGRLAAMRNAEIKGQDIEKEWVATLDFKTRDAHRDLDGQRVPVGDPFVYDGDDIMEPRDPRAKAYLRCNCRCAMRRVMNGWKRDGERKENIRHYNDDGTWYKPMVPNMTYNEWYQMKVREIGEVEIRRQVKEMRREQARRYYRKRRRQQKAVAAG